MREERGLDPGGLLTPTAGIPPPLREWGQCRLGTSELPFFPWARGGDATSESWLLHPLTKLVTGAPQSLRLLLSALPVMPVPTALEVNLRRCAVTWLALTCIMPDHAAASASLCHSHFWGYCFTEVMKLVLKEWGLASGTLLLTRSLHWRSASLSSHHAGLWYELPLILLMRRPPGAWYRKNRNKRCHSFANIN